MIETIRDGVQALAAAFLGVKHILAAGANDDGRTFEIDPFQGIALASARLCGGFAAGDIVLAGGGLRDLAAVGIRRRGGRRFAAGVGVFFAALRGSTHVGRDAHASRTVRGAARVLFAGASGKTGQNKRRAQDGCE